MRRPFAVIGFTYLAVLCAASYAGFGICASLACICAVSGAVVFFCFPFLKIRVAVTTAFCAAAAAFFAFCIAESVFYFPAASLSGKTAEISGEIADQPVASYGNYYYTINADSIIIDGKKSPVKTKIRLKLQSELSAEPFDRVTAQAILSVPMTQNSYGYDSRAVYKSKGIYLFAAADTVTVKKQGSKPPYYYAILLRQYISGAIDKFVGGTPGALAAGILIGDTSNLPQSVSNDFASTGISHILAVSGTQTSLIMEYLMLLLCFLKVPRRPAAGITAAAIIVFVAVTGFSPSVMRAGVMALVCLAAIIIKRDADVINSLGISALVLCLANPYAARDVGLLLSLTATLGMVTVSKRLYRFLDAKLRRLPEGKVSRGIQKVCRAPLGLLCETTGASLLTYPVIVVVFGRVSLISLIVNMVEVPISLFVTLATAVIAILSPAWFLAFLIKPTAIIVRVLCAFMMFFASFCANLPFASVATSYGFVSIIVLFVTALFFLYFIFKKKGASGVICTVCAVLATVVGIFSYCLASRGVMTVATVENSGGAVVTSCGHAVVIDLPSGVSFPETAVETYLKAHNINEIDAVILTSYDKTRLRHLSLLESDMKVKSVYIPENGDSKTDTGLMAPKKISIPSKLRAPYGVTITMLPDKDGKKLLALVSCAMSKAVVTGGGNLGDFGAYSKKALGADLLIYGGDLDDRFIEAVCPKYAQGGLKSSAQTYGELICSGAQVDTKPCQYLTRGNGGYKLGD